VFIDGVKIVVVPTPISAHEMGSPSMQWLEDGSGGWEISVIARNSVPGHEYVLQANNDLSASNWRIASQPQLGNGGDLSFLASFLPIAGRDFFRIRISD
jgi:hypothetical protein